MQKNSITNKFKQYVKFDESNCFGHKKKIVLNKKKSIAQDRVCKKQVQN